MTHSLCRSCRSTVAALVLALLLAAPAGGTSVVPGSSVEIEQFYYSFYLDGSGWSLECIYRVDEGEWQTASAEGGAGERILRLPGTSVQATAEGFDVRWTCGEEVVSLRIAQQRVF
jgi:hypothetical protein